MKKYYLVVIFLFAFVFLGATQIAYSETDAKLEELSSQQERLEQMKTLVNSFFALAKNSDKQEIIESALNNVISKIDNIQERVKNRIEEKEREEAEEKDKEKETEDEYKISEEIVFSAIEDEIEKRYQERKEDIQKIKETLNEYSQKIEEERESKSGSVSDASYCQRCLPLIAIGGGIIECNYDEEKCDQLKKTHDNIIKNLENKRDRKIEQVWPKWDSSLPSTEAPEIKLFTNNERFEIEVAEEIIEIKALSKLDGGYLLNIDVITGIIPRNCCCPN